MSTVVPVWRIYLKLLLAAIFWGGTFIAGKLLAGEVSPFSSAFIRFLLATLVLLLLCRYYNGRLPRLSRDDLVPVLFLGLSGVFAYNAFFFAGLYWIEASRAAVIVANNPVMIALFAALLFGEKLTPRAVLGIGLSVAGAITVVIRGDLSQLVSGGIGRGELLIFGCVLSWTTYSLVGRRAMRNLSPLIAVTSSAAAGTLLLAPFALAEGLLSQFRFYSMQAWASLIYLALFGTVIGFVWYYQGILRLGSTRAGQFINFVPIAAVTLSIGLLDEPLTSSLLLGLLLVISGLYLTNRR
ncbi:MAG: DMT family transporter [Pelovirga sp.]